MGEAVDGDEVEEAGHAFDGVEGAEHGVDGVAAADVLLELEDGGLDLAEVVEGFGVELLEELFVFAHVEVHDDVVGLEFLEQGVAFVEGGTGGGFGGLERGGVVGRWGEGEGVAAGLDFSEGGFEPDVEVGEELEGVGVVGGGGVEEGVHLGEDGDDGFVDDVVGVEVAFEVLEQGVDGEHAFVGAFFGEEELGGELLGDLCEDGDLLSWPAVVADDLGLGGGEFVGVGGGGFGWGEGRVAVEGDDGGGGLLLEQFGDVVLGGFVGAGLVVCGGGGEVRGWGVGSGEVGADGGAVLEAFEAVGAPLREGAHGFDGGGVEGVSVVEHGLEHFEDGLDGFG